MRPVVLPPKDREREIAGLAKLLAVVHPGKPVRVKIEIARPDKTGKQNAFLWAIPYKMLSEVTGFEAEDLHENNCGHQWGWKEVKSLKTPSNPTGIQSIPIRTTTRDEHGEPDNCSAEEMVQLWHRAQRWGANLEISIPDPDKSYFTKRSKGK